jgi:prepilin-type N-terminal cleavage/methylation domain-containing protein
MAVLRRGLTLVELLVVVAIAGLLVSLLMPAVQSARESARRVACGNGLKQVALGILLHEQQHGMLPYSTPEAAYHDDVDELARQNLSPDGVSWMVRLLPYVEQASLFDSMRTSGTLASNQGLVTNDAATRRAIRTTLPVYLCPSDNATGKTRTDVWSDSNRYAGIPIAVSNYAGVIGPCGIFTGGVNLVGTSPYCNNRNSTLDPTLVTCPGSFWRHSYYAPVLLAGFRDGTSNTQIVGERVPAGDRDTQGLNPWSAWPAANTAHSFHTMGLNFVDRVNAFNADGTPRLSDARNAGFGSRHARGALFAYADGRVAFTDDLVAISVYYALSTRSGGPSEPRVEP